MKVKRAKTHKRSLAFYRHHFGLREPYQVLVDGTLVHAAVRYQIDLFEAMPRVLHAPVKLLVTPCVFAELEALNDRAFAPTLKVMRKQMDRRRCNHATPLAASECLQSMVGTDNEHRFMVATQDARLRSRLRSTVAAAPLIFLNKVVLLVEPPSALALATANKHEHLKTMPEAHEKTPVVAPATTAPKRKKKRIAAPNPLSCQKKKKNTAKMTKDKKDASVTMIEDKKKKADASLAVAVAVAEGEAMKEGDTVAASSQVSTGNALAKKRRRRPHRSHKNGTDSGTPRAETPDTPR